MELYTLSSDFDMILKINEWKQGWIVVGIRRRPGRLLYPLGGFCVLYKRFMDVLQPESLPIQSKYLSVNEPVSRPRSANKYSKECNQLGCLLPGRVHA